MIPSVTVSSKPNGFPIARTKSPACTASESPSFSGFTSGLVDLQNSEIDLRIGADQPRLARPAIAQLHFDFVHLIDHVIIRDDVAFISHDHARAERILHHRFLVRVAKLARSCGRKTRNGSSRTAGATDDLLRCLHAHDRREHAADQRAPFADSAFSKLATSFGSTLGVRRQRVFLRRRLREQVQTAVLAAGNRKARKCAALTSNTKRRNLSRFFIS